MAEEFKSFLNTVEGNEERRCHYPTRLDTYGCGCEHDCRYCLHPDTPVLLQNGKTKPIKAIEYGDMLVGVKDVKTLLGISALAFAPSMVLNKWSVKKEAYRITFDDRKEVICSGDHRWLTSKKGWRYTAQPHGLSVGDSIIGTPDGITFNRHTIVSIEPLGKEEELIDITTSTENFIANGLISHNCYAKSLLSFRGFWHPKSPSVADINEIRKAIKKELKPGQIVRLGGMTDCFQPSEREHRVTLKTIQALNEAGVGYLIVTKNKLVAEREYLEVMDRRLAHIQVSITTTDAGISKHYEPGASLPEERIAAAERLQAEGFDVSVRLSPFIPQWVNMDRINSIRVDKILVEFLRVNAWIKKWMKDVDLRPYSLNKNGYKHLPIAQKRELIKKIKGFKEISVCEDVYGHWLWWKDHLNANPEDCCNLRIRRK